MTDVSWLAEPEDHDHPAAHGYLTLIAEPDCVAVLVDGLRRAETAHRKAKDILRASGLPVLAAEDPHVDSDLKKIKKAEALSPILLVRGEMAAGRFLQIADGYHRVCASFLTDANTPIPCRMVDLPSGR
jgi:hypothetical protein